MHNDISIFVDRFSKQNLACRSRVRHFAAARPQAAVLSAAVEQQRRCSETIQLKRNSTCMRYSAQAIDAARGSVSVTLYIVVCMFAYTCSCPGSARPAQACLTFGGPNTFASWQRQHRVAKSASRSVGSPQFHQCSAHSLCAVAPSSPAELGLTEQQSPVETDSGEQQDEFLEIGKIVTTHGVKGEVKVQALTDFPEERLMTPGIRYGASRPLTVADVAECHHAASVDYICFACLRSI